jgi:hypothetical protein
VSCYAVMLLLPRAEGREGRGLFVAGRGDRTSRLLGAWLPMRCMLCTWRLNMHGDGRRGRRPRDGRAREEVGRPGRMHGSDRPV